MSQVFISHSTADRSVADQFVQLLESSGVRCWIANRDLLPGSAHMDEIPKQIEAAICLVVLFSKHAADSANVASEVALAFNRKLMIAPLRIDAHPAQGRWEYVFVNSQWLNVSGESGLRDVSRALIDRLRPLMADSATGGIPAPMVKGVRVPQAVVERRRVSEVERMAEFELLRLEHLIDRLTQSIAEHDREAAALDRHEPEQASRLQSLYAELQQAHATASEFKARRERHVKVEILR